jgi:hypothetical protein
VVCYLLADPAGLPRLQLAQNSKPVHAGEGAELPTVSGKRVILSFGKEVKTVSHVRPSLHRGRSKRVRLDSQYDAHPPKQPQSGSADDSGVAHQAHQLFSEEEYLQSKLNTTRRRIAQTRLPQRLKDTAARFKSLVGPWILHHESS